jgi:carboxypeptidase D
VARGPRDIAYVRVPRAALTREVVAATQFNRDHKRDDLYAFGYVPRALLPSLERAARGDLIELDARALAHAEYGPVSVARDRAAEDYHNYDALTSELQALAAAHPQHALVDSAGKSVQGRDLWVIKISKNAATEEHKPNLLYIANMHGDESVGRELMIYLARRLLQDYGTDARITKLVDAAQIYIMPSMNPDGFEASDRFNADSVDLNRDFPDFTADPSDSENGRAPETKAVMELHGKHHFLMALNFHGGTVCFNVPWDSQPNQQASQRFGDDPLMQKLARTYADGNATMQANNVENFDHGVTYGYEWYLVNGGMQDWSVYYRNSIHATVELSYTKYPSASQLPGMWTENQEVLLGYLEAGLFGVHLAVKNEQGQPITGATVRVQSLNRDVLYTDSFVHRPALPGAQTVTVSAPGYKTRQIEMTPWTFAEGTYQDVVLSP